MKKRINLLLAVLFVCMLFPAFSSEEDLGIQLIGGENAATQTVSLDDMQLGKKHTIDGYAILNLIKFESVDMFAQFNKGTNGDLTEGRSNDNYRYCVYKDGNYDPIKNATWKTSGTNAEFIVLHVDITNLQKTPVSFLSEGTVKLVYDDGYEFSGWIRQSNYDYAQMIYRHSDARDLTIGHNPLDLEAPSNYLQSLMLDPENDEPIGMLYTGHFYFGCTVPNEVVTSKKPLRMEIKLGGNDLTYHIRK